MTVHIRRETDPYIWSSPNIHRISTTPDDILKYFPDGLSEFQTILTNQIYITFFE